MTAAAAMSHGAALRPAGGRAEYAEYGERGRDPYDALRPWSALTHGAGALLALPGRSAPRFGCHEIFHLFVLAGSVLHYLLILRLV